MKKFAVIAFSKEPKPGTVKTRLSPQIPPEGAAYIYEALLWDTIDILIALKEAEKYIFFTPDDSSYFLDLERSGFRVIPQTSGSLGDRMAKAISLIIEETGLPAMITGTDCPLLSPALIRKCASLFETHDAVLGPSEDGGYYLIGLKTFTPRPFENIPWSTDRVFSTTLEALEKNGLKVATGEMLFDVDRPEDIIKYARLLEEKKLPDEFKRRRFAKAALKLSPHLLHLLRGR